MAKIEAALQPATISEIVSVLTRLGQHFWQSDDRTKAEVMMLIEDYCEDLAPYPIDLIVAACKEWRCRGRFFPKVAELLPLLQSRYRDRIAKRDFLRSPPPPVPTHWDRDTEPRELPTEEEKRRVSEIVADITRSFSSG